MTRKDPEYEYILNKARHFCDYQERCIKEVTDKLNSWKVKKVVMEKVVERLIKEEFLNEDRFVRLFVTSKFRNFHWGRNKIIHELQKRNIPDLIIQIGLQEIDDEEYLITLAELLIKKSREIRSENPLQRKQKLMTFAVGKGYHYEAVRQVMREHGKELRISE